MALQLTHQNKLYMGTYSNGLVVMDLVTKKLQQYKQGLRADALNSNDIFCIKEDRFGKIWVGTNGGGVNVLGADHKAIIKYCKNPKAINEVDYPGNNFIRFIEEDPSGNVWIGSYGSGIAVFNQAEKKFSVLNKIKNNLPNDLALSILKDHSGDLWIGTFSGGLSLYNRITKQFTTYGEKEGLNNATVYAIEEDKQGRIWLSTNKGISSFDRKRLTDLFKTEDYKRNINHNNQVRQLHAGQIADQQ